MKGCDHEMRFRLYYPDTADYVEVCEDADGLGLTELRYRDEEDKIGARITLNEEQVRCLIRSLIMMRDFKKVQALERGCAPEQPGGAQPKEIK